MGTRLVARIIDVVLVAVFSTLVIIALSFAFGYDPDGSGRETALKASAYAILGGASWAAMARSLTKSASSAIMVVRFIAS